MPNKNKKKLSRGRNKASKSRTAKAPTKSEGPRVAFSLKETLPVFPAAKLVTQQLYYDSQKQLSGTAGVLARYVYTANGAYDPDITGTGHQMMGFDQMMLFFEQCVVVHSRIRVTFYSGSATIQRCALSLTPDATAAASVTDLVENGLTVMTTVGGSGDNGSTRGTSTLELSCDVGKYFGRSRAMLVASPEFYCTAAANPIEQVYFQIQTWNPTTTTNTSVYFDVVLSYDIYYYEPRKVGSSFWHLAVEALKLKDSLDKRQDVERGAESKKGSCVSV